MSNKLILVYYVGIKGWPPDTVSDMLDEIKADTVIDDYNVRTLIVPVPESREFRVECVNPVLLTPEKYEEVSKTITKLETELKSVIENYGRRT